MLNFLRHSVVALVVATLTLAGPIAGTLAIVSPLGSHGKVAVKPTFEKQDVFSVRTENGDYLVQVQNDAPSPAEVPGAADATDAVPPTANQEVVLEWGNWVGVLLKPIQDIALSVIPLVGLYLMSLVPGWMRLFFPATRVNELLENAIKQAIAGVKGATDGKKLTIPVTNSILAQAAVYVIAQAPDLAKNIADQLPLLVQKLMARLPQFADVPAGYSIEQAIKSVTEKEVKARAKAQGLGKDPKDPLNAYFGS